MLLCWWFRCAGDFVVLVNSLCRWFCCAGDVRWCVRCAGDFVALVMLCWWFCCAGDFVALVMLLCWWWFRCAGGDVVVLVSCLFVNCCPGAFAETKRFVFLLQRFALRSPRTWLHSGSWFPSSLRKRTGLFEGQRMFSANTGCIVQRKHACCKEVIYQGSFPLGFETKISRKLHQHQPLKGLNYAISGCWRCLICVN